MQLLEERIRKDGIIKEGNVLKVDRFLNHQMDIHCLKKSAKSFTAVSRMPASTRS